MKKLFLLVFVVSGIRANAQLTLEHTYDSASVWNICQGNYGQLMIVNFEVSGERYIKVNRCGDRIDIYDLNHAPLSSIPLAGIPHEAPYNTLGDFLYFSESLFDTDPGMEFMYVSDSGGFATTKIYNEDGSLLFTEFGAPYVVLNVHQVQYPIYNTANGTKLILSYSNGQAKVFSLPGTLTTDIGAVNNNLLSSARFISDPYPNPAASAARIDYTFPDGVNEGEIVFYNLAGQEIRRFHVDSTSDHLLVSTSDMAAGTYYYQLQTTTQDSGGKKIVVIGQ
jgi:hypothetical protein